MIFKKGCSVDPTTFIPDRAIEIATVPKGTYKDIGYLVDSINESELPLEDLFELHKHFEETHKTKHSTINRRIIIVEMTEE